ncbi:MAG: hypothetical protein NTW95_11890 [Candidatus Aminicenantes bacterium]|nr:hypothetical protein [Candidatus Aminicenantes bacterium]
MKKWLFFLSVAMIAAIGLPLPDLACTTAVIGSSASATGRPLLWKNRDTDFLSNKIIFVKENPFSYLALVNAEDRSGRWVYAGLNSAGFAIFNSVAYNLPEKGGEVKDMEGTIMADALRRCASVADFESYIQENLGPSLGSLANFGVLDAAGETALFEVSNHAYKKFRTADFPEKYIINTNFARSGEAEAGAGYLRFERASQLFRQVLPLPLSHQQILSQFSRDTGHALVRQPAWPQFKAISAKQPFWIATRDTIDRDSTSAAIIVCGRMPGRENSLATLWVMLGEPLFSIAVPMWVEAGASTAPLQQGEKAAIYLEAKRLQKKARPYPETDRRAYLDVTRLDNRQGTGFLPRLLETEREIFALTDEFLKMPRSGAELAAFQNRMAEKALAGLQGIK